MYTILRLFLRWRSRSLDNFVFPDAGAPRTWMTLYSSSSCEKPPRFQFEGICLYGLGVPRDQMARVTLTEVVLIKP